MRSIKTGLITLMISGIFSPISLANSKTFNINVQTPAEMRTWKALMELNPVQQVATWNSYKASKIALKDLHWTWRLGWMQICQTSNAEVCPAILAEGLKDNALLVRNKAVRIIGERYENRGESGVLIALALETIAGENPWEFNATYYMR